MCVQATTVNSVPPILGDRHYGLTNVIVVGSSNHRGARADHSLGSEGDGIVTTFALGENLQCPYWNANAREEWWDYKTGTSFGK